MHQVETKKQADLTSQPYSLHVLAGAHKTEFFPSLLKQAHSVINSARLCRQRSTRSSPPRAECWEPKDAGVAPHAASQGPWLQARGGRGLALTARRPAGLHGKLSHVQRGRKPWSGGGESSHRRRAQGSAESQPSALSPQGRSQHHCPTGVARTKHSVHQELPLPAQQTSLSPRPPLPGLG